ncbi:unnamed protein product, partial [marine sediment metagenome]
ELSLFTQKNNFILWFLINISSYRDKSAEIHENNASLLGIFDFIRGDSALCRLRAHRKMN